MLRTRLQLLFLFSGVAMAVFLGIHLAVQLLNKILTNGEPNPTSWLSMMGRATQGSWIAIYIFLLAFAIYHGLYGLRGIILEMVASDRTEKAVSWAFVIGGIAVFGWACYIPLAWR